MIRSSTPSAAQRHLTPPTPPSRLLHHVSPPHTTATNSIPTYYQRHPTASPPAPQPSITNIARGINQHYNIIMTSSYLRSHPIRILLQLQGTPNRNIYTNYTHNIPTATYVIQSRSVHIPASSGVGFRTVRSVPMIVLWHATINP